MRLTRLLPLALLLLATWSAYADSFTISAVALAQPQVIGPNMDVLTAHQSISPNIQSGETFALQIVSYQPVGEAFTPQGPSESYYSGNTSFGIFDTFTITEYSDTLQVLSSATPFMWIYGSTESFADGYRLVSTSLEIVSVAQGLDLYILPTSTDVGPSDPATFEFKAFLLDSNPNLPPPPLSASTPELPSLFLVATGLLTVRCSFKRRRSA
jgi:hypothetical protein